MPVGGLNNIIEEDFVNVDDILGKRFVFFWPCLMSQEEADKLIGQQPKFDIMGTPAGNLKIIGVKLIKDKYRVGIELKVERID